ncbi:Apc13p-domain-containing protein [Periconia macrospinosa]|uniref:Apc13p-domain-containing protein n=1 Tax=Periconia macrospinosa TaxID=97972 RepID=A0A2V1DDT9_9PLEO|nr:Apc13p-domain-containing protein [Periconia macrospinosa]
MTRDSTATYLHLHQSHHADLIEDFTRPSTSALPPEDIYIPPHLQPVNPEDEDDVVPDQHAAFGIQRATQGKKEINWQDFGLDELVRRAPGERMGETSGGTGGAGAGGVAGGAGTAGTRTAAQRDEPVRLALRRRHGAGTASARTTVVGGGGAQGANGGAGNGLPR